MAAFRPESASARTGGAPEQLTVVAASGNYFETLGVPAALGRAMAVDDDRPGAAAVLMLSDRFWRRRFAADTTVIGQTLTVNGRIATIIGVSPIAPPTFALVPLLPAAAAFAAWYLPARHASRIDPLEALRDE